MNRKVIGILAAAFIAFPLTALSQAGPIRGEISAGSYGNIKTDAAGNLYTTPAAGVATTVAYTQTPVTVANSSSTILAANTSRRFVLIQNNDTLGNIFINFTAAATTAAFKIAAGATLLLDTAVSNQLITAIGSIASNPNVTVIEGQ